MVKQAMHVVVEAYQVVDQRRLVDAALGLGTAIECIEAYCAQHPGPWVRLVLAVRGQPLVDNPAPQDDVFILRLLAEAWEQRHGASVSQPLRDHFGARFDRPSFRPSPRQHPLAVLRVYSVDEFTDDYVDVLCFDVLIPERFVMGLEGLSWDSTAKGARTPQLRLWPFEGQVAAQTLPRRTVIDARGQWDLQPDATTWQHHSAPCCVTPRVLRGHGPHVWVGCKNHLLRISDGGDIARLAPHLPLPGLDRIIDLAPTADGAVWIATEYGLIHCSASGTWRHHPRFEPPIPITALAAAPDGALWLSTPGHLYTLDPEQQVRRTQSLSHGPIRQISVDAAGHVWISDDESLRCLDASGKTLLRRTKFEPNLRGHFTDPHGTCWLIGTGIYIQTDLSGKHLGWDFIDPPLARGRAWDYHPTHGPLLLEARGRLLSLSEHTVLLNSSPALPAAPPKVRFFSLACTAERVWLGTSHGLIGFDAADLGAGIAQGLDCWTELMAAEESYFAAAAPFLAGDPLDDELVSSDGRLSTS